MADTLLDKLDADPGGARRYVAALYSYGASHEQAAQKLAEHFALARVPSKRILGEWRRNDPQLRAIIDELDLVKRDLTPDASPADVLANVPAPIDPCELSMAIFALHEECPAWSDLSHRAANDPDFPDDADQVALREGEGMSDAEFEALCRERADGWDPQGYVIAKHYAKSAPDAALPEAAQPYAHFFAF